MHVIARKKLVDSWTTYPDSKGPLESWYNDAKRSVWKSPADIKTTYANASVLPDNWVVFNIKGNRYRLIVHVHYNLGRVYIRWFGTHADYDKIDDVTTV